MAPPAPSSLLDAACPLREPLGEVHDHPAGTHHPAHPAPPERQARSRDHDHDEHDHDHDAHGEHAGHGRGAHAGHDHHHDLQGTPTRRLAFALALTASFMGVEAAVGWWSGSLSLLADAGHMFADAGALAMAIAAQRIASKPRTAAQTYGYRRAEVIAAFVNGVLLAGVALMVIVEAIQRFGAPRDVDGSAMSITAAAGLGVNLIAAWVLSRGEGGNVNVRAALAHVLSDALGSVGALTAGLLVVFAGLRWADPAASTFIALLVAWGAFRLVRETVHVLMQGAPPGLDCRSMEEAVRAVPGVVGLHDLHVWRVSDGLDVVTLHVVVADAAEGTRVARLVTSALRERFGAVQVTVQPEVAP